MKVKKLFLFASIAIGLVCITILLNPFKEDLWDKNLKLLKQQLLSINQPAETIKLSDITPFEWNEVYSFEPYMPKEKVYNAIGYRWHSHTI